MNELDNEDSKKDTLVDVVFKKALKEFRQNIFSFYSSALAVSDRSRWELAPPGDALSSGRDVTRPSIPDLLILKERCSSFTFSPMKL